MTIFAQLLIMNSVLGAALFELPVQWQLTRSRTIPTGNQSTITETYRETWQIAWPVDQNVTLRSWRDEIPVYVGPQIRDADTGPQHIILQRQDLMRLLGLTTNPGPTNNAPVTPPAYELITLKLKPVGTTRGQFDLSVRTSDDEHISIHFEYGESNKLRQTANNN